MSFYCTIEVNTGGTLFYGQNQRHESMGAYLNIRDMDEQRSIGTSIPIGSEVKEQDIRDFIKTIRKFLDGEEIK